MLRFIVCTLREKGSMYMFLGSTYNYVVTVLEFFPSRDSSISDGNSDSFQGIKSFDSAQKKESTLSQKYFDHFEDFF